MPSPGTLSAAGYTFQFVNGTLTISPAVLKVTAYSYTRTYGAPLPGTFAYSITRFVNGDMQTIVGGVPSIASIAVLGSPVGSHPVTPSLGSLTASNYSFAFVNGALTISP